MDIKFRFSDIFITLLVCQYSQGVLGVFRKIDLLANWTRAERTCASLENRFLADVGRATIQSKILPLMSVDELIWINAKNVLITYGSSIQVLSMSEWSKTLLSNDPLPVTVEVVGSNAYKFNDIARAKSPVRYANLKISYQLAASSFYYCYEVASPSSGNEKGKKIKMSKEFKTWKDAKRICEEKQGTLLNVDTPQQPKLIMAMLKLDKMYWVNNYTGYKIPNMESAELQMTESCIGIVKKSDTDYIYKTDNCTEKHTFICDSSSTQYAPTIERLSKPLPKCMANHRQDDGNTSETGIAFIKTPHGPTESNPVGRIVGGSVGGVLGLVLVAVFAIFSVRRWRDRREYKNSLHRYNCRQPSSARLYVANGDTRRLCIGKPSLPLSADMLQYEDCDKQKYSDLQQDVVRDINAKRTRNEADAATALSGLPTYHSMDGYLSLKQPKGSRPQEKDCDKQKYSDLQQDVVRDINAKRTRNEADAATALSGLPTYHSMDGYLSLKQPKGSRPQEKELISYELYDPNTPNTSIQRQLQQGRYINNPLTYASPQLSDLENNENNNLGTQTKKADEITKLDDLTAYENNATSKTTKQALKVCVGQGKKKIQINSEKPDKVQSLDDLDGYENTMVSPTLPVKKYKAKKLADLDTYENYGKPPGKAAEGSSPTSLDDLEHYEGYMYQMPSKQAAGDKKKVKADNIKKEVKVVKEITRLDDLDQYENFQSPKSQVSGINREIMNLNDLDNYESYQLP